LAERCASMNESSRDGSRKDEVLTQSTMLNALGRCGLHDLQVDVFDSLPSTSEYLSAMVAKQKEDGSPSTRAARLCVTDWQTNGNGRRGKTWVTQRGNITFSMMVTLKKPPAMLMGLSLVTGVCVAESMKALVGLSVDLKWPNDVLVADKKLCGLLTELVSNTPNETHVVVGIGINYKRPAHIEAGDYSAVDLPELVESPPSRAQLISDVAARVLREYAVFETQGWAAFADRWDSFDYLKGRKVRVLTEGAEEQAVAAGVDAQGALLVSAGGVTRALYSGEVSLRLA